MSGISGILSGILFFILRGILTRRAAIDCRVKKLSDAAKSGEVE